MKSRSLIPVVLMVMLLFGAIAPLAMADMDFQKCKILKMGYNPTTTNGYYVQLVDLSASPKWTPYRVFYLSPELGTQGLAILLTANSMGRDVWVRIASATPTTVPPAGSLIKILYICE
jgi:hypothetical protein